MMKHIFPAMILLSIGGIIVFAGTQGQALWAMIPTVVTVVTASVVFSVFAAKPTKSA